MKVITALVTFLIAGALIFAIGASAKVRSAHFKPILHSHVISAPKVYRGHRIRHYAWERCSKKCVKIKGATFRKHNIVKADRGKKLRVLVTIRERNQVVTLASGKVTVTSGQTPPIAPPDPVNSSLPVLSGVAEQGTTLTATEGTWQNAVSFTNQWQRCTTPNTPSTCTDISGATGLSYTLQAADTGDVLQLVVTAFNTSQGTTQATSLAS